MVPFRVDFYGKIVHLLRDSHSNAGKFIDKKRGKEKRFVLGEVSGVSRVFPCWDMCKHRVLSIATVPGETSVQIVLISSLSTARDPFTSPPTDWVASIFRKWFEHAPVRSSFPRITLKPGHAVYFSRKFVNCHQAVCDRERQEGGLGDSHFLLGYLRFRFPEPVIGSTEKICLWPSVTYYCPFSKRTRQARNETWNLLQ